MDKLRELLKVSNNIDGFRVIEQKYFLLKDLLSHDYVYKDFVSMITK